MDVTTANFVRDRARNCCEYCHLNQADEPFLRFHIEHIIPRQHGGDDHLENLALACNRCNRHKGTNLAGIDPYSRQIIPLFHPRQQEWQTHFEWRGIRIAGRSAIGRATAEVLKVNETARLDLRETLRARRKSPID